jgi:predicted phage tail protein
MVDKRRKSLSTLLDHFTSVQSNEIARAGDAILKNDWNQLQAIAGVISRSEITTSIHDLVSSSKASFSELVGKFESTFDPDVWKFIAGGVMMGVGGAALAEVGLGAALTLSTLTIQVLAVALLLWGLSLCLGVIWKRASAIISDLRTS